jgi:hypothetical protein
MVNLIKNTKQGQNTKIVNIIKSVTKITQETGIVGLLNREAECPFLLE